MKFEKPKRWSTEELTTAAARAREEFAESRKGEGPDYYLMAFDNAHASIIKLFDDSNDLALLEERARDLLSSGHLNAMRYLASPAISQDDLKALTGLASLSASTIQAEGSPEKIVKAITNSIDIRRFPWFDKNERPSKEERAIAEIATASLIANQDAQTQRRGQAKQMQENAVAKYLESKGFEEVPRRTISTLSDAPQRMEYCKECKVSSKKADVVIGLGDGRFMALECKVSNSQVNSFKRLNHETVEKVGHWRQAFGENGVVGAAVLAGVYKVENLIDAQDEGVAIFWSSDLSPLGLFLDNTNS